jgi:integrase
MSLNVTQLRTLKPKEKAYKVTDRDGLYLAVLPSGYMSWRYQYYFNDKRENLTLGRYPALSLADARKLRDEAEARLVKGISPAEAKQDAKRMAREEAARAPTFEELCHRWYDEDCKDSSPKWRYTVQNWLKLDIIPALGAKRPASVTASDVQALIRKVVARGSPSSAAKIRLLCDQIFRYAMRQHELAASPMAMVPLVNTPPTQSHRPLAVHEIGPFLHALEADGCRESTRLAIKLLLLTFTRKDELRLARWSEFDLQNAIWQIPGHRMKAGVPHRVYLARQVLELLAQLRPLSFGSELLFPQQNKPRNAIGHTTINSTVNRIAVNGAHFVPHGFRATASSILNEAGFRSDVIERQLAHKESNKVRAVYNRAEYAGERQEMLQWWADYLDALRNCTAQPPYRARPLGIHHR